MINVTVFMGKIIKDDEFLQNIRYVEICQDYHQNDGKIKKDLIPVMNWNKLNKGELFTFSEGSLLLIKGRLEYYNGKFVVVCESLSYLGKEQI